MKRLIVLGCCGLALMLAAGCGDDEATKPTPKETGDLNDPEFLQTQEQILGLSEQALDMLANTFSVIGSIADAGPAAVAPTTVRIAGKALVDTTEYHESSQYWYYESRDTIDFGGQVTELLAIDSVQFWHGAEAVQWPDSALVTAVKVGSRFLIDNLTTGDSLAAGLIVTISGDAGELASGGDALIDGAGYFRGKFSETEADTTCDLEFNFATDYNNLALNLDDVFENDGCPTGGSFVHVGSLQAECSDPTDTLSFSGQWSATLAFSGENLAFVFENATTRWAGATTCGDLHQAVSAYDEPFAQALRSSRR